jgi:transcriptional regulator with XRE-family HTH domain
MPGRKEDALVGRRIVAVRQRRGLSQAAVSRRAGLHQSYLSRLEAGKFQPNLRTAQRVATALRISLHELLGPSSRARTERACSVSVSGQCLMDLVDSTGEFGVDKGPARYSARQLRLIRRFTALVGRNEKKMLTALELLVASLLQDGNGERQASKKKPSAGRRRQMPPRRRRQKPARRRRRVPT